MVDYIPLQTWWLGVVSYSVCHALHIIAWRRGLLPQNLFGLGALFFVVPGVLLIAFSMGPLPTASVVAPCIIHFLLAANYIAIYPAIQASSPTLQILILLKRASTGLEGEDIQAALATRTVMADRMGDLLRSKLIRQTEPEGKLALSWRGRVLAAFFSSYRQFIGLARGAG